MDTKRKDAFAYALGNELCEFRNSHGLTQQQMADIIGCKRNYISDIERGEKCPSSVVIYNYYDKLGLDVNKTFKKIHL